MDQAIRQTRRVLQTLANPVIEATPPDPPNGVAKPAVDAFELERDDAHLDHNV
jgi:hypothetical protein